MRRRVIVRLVVVAGSVSVAGAACSLFVDHGGLTCDDVEDTKCGSVAPGADADVAENAGADADVPVDAADSPDVSAGTRPTAGLIALWTFDETSGSVVRDTSTFTPPLDLAITVDGGGSRTSWTDGGLQIDAPVTIVSNGAAQKISTRCMVTEEVTLEAWVTPANATQNPARVAGIAPTSGKANVSVRAEGAAYVGYTSSNELVGAAGSVSTALTHVVLTKSADKTRRLYLNGALNASDALGVSFAEWQAFPMTIAAASDGTSPWIGTLHLVAIYDRALAADEIAASFAAGP